MIPDHRPALNIPSITEHPVNKFVIKNNNNTPLILFIVQFSLLINNRAWKRFDQKNQAEHNVRPENKLYFIIKNA